jgi:hypothetical protein
MLPPTVPRTDGGRAVPHDGKTIVGRWEKAEDGSTWDTDFDLTYRRVG